MIGLLFKKKKTLSLENHVATLQEKKEIKPSYLVVVLTFRTVWV